MGAEEQMLWYGSMRDDGAISVFWVFSCPFSGAKVKWAEEKMEG